MAVGANVVPHSVRAKTEDQLTRKMALIAAKRGTYIPFFDIQQKNTGEWVAWYNTELKTKLTNITEDK